MPHRDAASPAQSLSRRTLLHGGGRGAVGAGALALGDDPYSHGSYAAFRPGQFTWWWGFVGQREHRVHFAGEHTSMRALGYLDGAVASGRRAAHEVLAGN